MAEVTTTEKRTVKLEKEEIDNINTIRRSYSEINNKMGDVSMNIVVLEDEMEKAKKMRDQLSEQYRSLRASEIKTSTDMKAKYGDGEIDLEAGTFTAL